MNRLGRIGLPLLGLILLGAAFYFAGEGDNSSAIFSGIGGGLAIALGALLHHPLAGAAVASTMGAGVSVYLTRAHYAALSGAESVCNINATFNCDVINTSQYSEVAGVPIALVGLGFYVGVAAFSALGWQGNEGSERAPALLLAAAIPACLYSAFLAWASTQVGAWCLFCISLYITNAVLLLAGFLATRDDGFLSNVGPALMGQNDRSIGTGLAAGLAAIALGWIFLTGAKAPTAEQTAEDGDIGQLYEQPRGAVALDGSEPVWGRPDAPYLLLEFADYECPHCADMAKEVKKLVATYPELRVAFKHYPLSKTCNDAIPTPFHQNACMAAAAAVCAQEQGRFWELNNQMFANQTFLAREDITFMAGQLGLDSAALDTCMSDPATAERVRKDAAAGAKAGVDSTPTIFLRDVVEQGQWIKVTMGAEAVELLLKAKAAGEPLPAPAPPSPSPH